LYQGYHDGIDRPTSEENLIRKIRFKIRLKPLVTNDREEQKDTPESQLEIPFPDSDLLTLLLPKSENV
jgi:hypothetical protein